MKVVGVRTDCRSTSSNAEAILSGLPMALKPLLQLARKSISIRASSTRIGTKAGGQWHYDLLVLCAAVEFADRRCGRRSTRWSRQFQITLPVLEPATWKQAAVQVPLQDTLRHLTGDEWHLSFVQSADSAAVGCASACCRSATTGISPSPTVMVWTLGVCLASLTQETPPCVFA